jgi:hypothetical protein
MHRAHVCNPSYAEGIYRRISVEDHSGQKEKKSATAYLKNN